MKKIFVLLVMLFLGIGKCFAYPITPRPLRQLIVESQYIISGKVLSVEKLERDTTYFTNQALAKIEISEIFKGSLKKQIIEVQFDDYIGCPQPARYAANTLVIAFIDLENGKFFTHALSYGSKTLEADELKVYRDRIVEMKEILNISNELSKHNATVDWLITCAENPATQWEGVFELSPHSNFMSYYSKGKQIEYGKFLSISQRERLMSILRKKALFDYGDFGIIDLIYDGNEQFIDTRLIDSLSKLGDFELIFTADYMQRLKHLLPPGAFKKCIIKAEEFSLDLADGSKQKKNIQKFISSIRR